MSIVISNNSTWSDSLTLINLIVRQYFGRRDFPRKLNWNFPEFASSEFKLSHLKMIFISSSRLSQIAERLSPQEKIALSWANLHISDFSVNKKTSVIKIIKSRSCRIDLWGMSLITLAQSVYGKPIFFLCFWKRSSTTLTTLTLINKAELFEGRFFWGTQFSSHSPTPHPLPAYFKKN